MQNSQLCLPPELRKSYLDILYSTVNNQSIFIPCLPFSKGIQNYRKRATTHDLNNFLGQYNKLIHLLNKQSRKNSAWNFLQKFHMTISLTKKLVLFHAYRFFFILLAKNSTSHLSKSNYNKRKIFTDHKAYSKYFLFFKPPFFKTLMLKLFQFRSI